MSDAASWSVRELKRYLRTNGINTRQFKEKRDLIELASKLLYEEERAEWIKDIITFIVIGITVLLLNVYFRPKIEKIFWLNPKWALSFIIMHLIQLIEYLLIINVILSWILPATLKEYNYIDKYFVKQIQLFPLSVPLDYDSQTDHASIWIDLYPMLLMYLLRKLKNYLTIHYHYAWYEKYRSNYYQQIQNIEIQDITDNIQDNIQDNTEDHIQNVNNENLENNDYDDDNDDEFDARLQQALLASLENN